MLLRLFDIDYQQRTRCHRHTQVIFVWSFALRLDHEWIVSGDTNTMITMGEVLILNITNTNEQAKPMTSENIAQQSRTHDNHMAISIYCNILLGFFTSSNPPRQFQVQHMR